MSFERRPLGGGEGIWSMVLESQLFPALARLASAVAPGKTGFEVLDFNQAARVTWSTGQISAGVSDSFVIFS